MHENKSNFPVYSSVEITDIENSSLEYGEKILVPYIYKEPIRIEHFTSNNGIDFRSNSECKETIVGLENILNPKNGVNLINVNKFNIILSSIVLNDDEEVSPWRLLWYKNIELNYKYDGITSFTRTQTFQFNKTNLPHGIIQFVASRDLTYRGVKISAGTLLTVYINKIDIEEPLITTHIKQYTYCPVIKGQSICILLPEKSTFNIQKNQSIYIQSHFRSDLQYEAFILTSFEEMDRIINGVCCTKDRCNVIQFHNNNKFIIDNPPNNFTIIRNGLKKFTIKTNCDSLLQDRHFLDVNNKLYITNIYEHLGYYYITFTVPANLNQVSIFNLYAKNQCYIS